MLTTGNQLKAARALAGMDQATLATSAGISTNTLSTMERRGAGMLSSGFETVRSVMLALQNAGIKFLDNGPGVQITGSVPPAPNLFEMKSRIQTKL